MPPDHPLPSFGVIRVRIPIILVLLGVISVHFSTRFPATYHKTDLYNEEMTGSEHFFSFALLYST